MARFSSHMTQKSMYGKSEFAWITESSSLRVLYFSGIYCLLTVATMLDLLTPELLVGLPEFIASCQTYEGGFGSASFPEWAFPGEFVSIHARVRPASIHSPRFLCFYRQSTKRIPRTTPFPWRSPWRVHVLRNRELDFTPTIPRHTLQQCSTTCHQHG